MTRPHGLQAQVHASERQEPAANSATLQQLPKETGLRERGAQEQLFRRTLVVLVVLKAARESRLAAGVEVVGREPGGAISSIGQLLGQRWRLGVERLAPIG